MREIKFRVWDTDNGNMYHSDRDEENGEGIIVWYANGEGVYFEEPQLIDRCPGGAYHEQTIEYRKPNQILMQFTGLLDKNGTEIFEGDVLAIEDNYVEGVDDFGRGPTLGMNHLAPVVFKNGCFGVEVPVSRPQGHLGPGYYTFATLDDEMGLEDIEAIGNIYESPELLKESA